MCGDSSAMLSEKHPDPFDQEWFNVPEGIYALEMYYLAAHKLKEAY